jgi:hypothetical protein
VHTDTAETVPLRRLMTVTAAAGVAVVITAVIIIWIMRRPR